MKKRYLHIIFPALLSIVTLPVAACAQAPVAPVNLVINGNFEIDANADQWPDDWGKLKEGGSYEVEKGNHFLRLTSPEADKMILEYREARIPKDVRAVELSYKWRVSNLKRGKNSWFDARIMMNWLDDARNKINPAPPTPSAGKNTEGWQEKRIKFQVPEGATMLALMPTLFQVQSGTLDLDDVVLTPTEAAPLAAEAKEHATSGAAKNVNEASQRQANAAKNGGPDGELIPNGDFQLDENGDGTPDKWSANNAPLSWETEDKNRFLRMVSPEPGKLVLFYRSIDIPANAKALELKWKQRITDLKLGKQGWFDARIMMDWKNAAGEKLKGAPSPPYSRKNTEGWVEKSTSFLVPDGAVSLTFMPALFQVEKGTYDLDNLSLRPTDPAFLIEARAKAAEEAKYINVAPEVANKTKWPSELHIIGNKLLDKDNKEVLLKGVNIDSLEWNPRGERVLRNTLVAIDEWKANFLRLPVNEQFWFDKDAGPAYRELIDNLITIAANRGAYVLLDLHRFRAPKKIHVDFWKDAAARYKNHPAVLFDLFNEPHGISWKVWKNGGFVEDKNAPADEDAFLSPEEKALNAKGFHSVGMQALIDAARSTGAKNIVVVGGLDWAYDASGMAKGFALNDKAGNGIMVATHIYAGKRDWQGKVLSVADKYPIVVSEFGANTKKFEFMPAESQEDAVTWVPKVFGFIQKNNFHYTAFSFHPGSAPRMLKGWDYTPTPEWGAFVKRALAGEQFADKGVR